MDASVTSILDLVDVDGTERAAAEHNEGEGEISAAVRAAAEKVGQDAYSAARYAGKTREESQVIGANAMRAALEKALGLTEEPSDVSFAPVTPRTVQIVTDKDRELGVVNEVGRVRSQADVDAARAAGFAMAETVYDRGTVVNETGVANARKSRIEHDALPSIGRAVDAFVAKISAEDRAITIVGAASIGMTSTGEITGLASPLPIERTAFSGLVNRLGYGGATYLADKCDPALRALNVNAQRATVDASTRIALRTRNNDGGGRGIFAAVTDSYTPFDVDKVASAIKLASGKDSRFNDARMAVKYDGQRATFDVSFHSDIRPEHYVAGEVYKAGVRISARDDGGGSISGSSTIYQNLCRNLLIVDRAEKKLFRLIHVGDVKKLAQRFADGFRRCLDSIAYFLKAWGYACKEDASVRLNVLDGDAPTSQAKALAGIFNGLLETKRVTMTGVKRSNAIDALVNAYDFDRSGAKLVHAVSRASIVNAITRVAHTFDFADPFQCEELESDAGALLWGKGDAAPAPLPYLAIDSGARA